MPTDQDHKKNLPTPPAGFYFSVDDSGLRLIEDATGMVLRVDFTSPGLSRRGQKSWKGEALLRAVGRKPSRAPNVLDATGGIGRDGFVMAQHGCRVRLCERNPLLFALVSDGLDRAGDNPDTADTAARITIHLCDSIDFMRNPAEKDLTEVIYLDPMYPERDKSALVKKEMQILRKICGHGSGEAELLTTALACAGSRVVVKRPKNAAPLSGPPPNTVIRGRAHRFDIYLPPPDRET